MVGKAIVEGLPGARAGVRASREVRFRGGGAGLGFLAVGLLLLTGCADRAAPSEATVEPEVTTYNQQEVTSNALSSGRLPILLIDDCDPADEAWNEVGGCTQRGGQINFGEFLAALPQGHPAWQNLPSYLRLSVRRLRVTAVNVGGREHTFTKVAEFGGGVIPLLNPPGQGPAPECADQGTFDRTFLKPGASLKVGTLPRGVHRYQCCIHPWMRTELRLH